MSKIFIYPTDTVWGIGGSISDLATYQEIARIKDTTADKPLSILFNSLEMASEYFNFSLHELELFEKILDFEVTIGVAKSKFKKNIPESVYANTEFICFRVLKNEVIDSIIENYGPITTTSLNKTRALPITELGEARAFWKKYAKNSLFYEPLSSMKLSGNSSTIVLFSGLDYRISREGLHTENILNVLNS